MVAGILTIFLAIGLGFILSDKSRELNSAMTELANNQNNYKKIPSDVIHSAHGIQSPIGIAQWILLPIMFLSAVGLFWIGWRGQTVMHITYFAGEKLYATSGHDQKLMEFSELVSHQLKK